MTTENPSEYAIEPVPAPPTQRVASPSSPFPSHIPPDLANQDVPCLNCGYNLRGLSPTSRCPECSALVQRSLQGNLLIYSSADYLNSLYRGLVCILVAVIASLVITIASVVIGVYVVVNGGPGALGSNDLQMFMKIAMLPTSAIMLWGWWLFSTPDPAIVGQERGQQPRTIIRVTVIMMAAASVASLLLNAATWNQPNLRFAEALGGLLEAAASVAQFFASLLYVRWLAPRIPDRHVFDTARLYLWLLPLIYILGMCLIVGPLVATVMYFVFLNTLRLRIGVIRHRQAAEVQFPVAA